MNRILKRYLLHKSGSSNHSSLRFVKITHDYMKIIVVDS